MWVLAVGTKVVIKNYHFCKSLFSWMFLIRSWTSASYEKWKSFCLQFLFLLPCWVPNIFQGYIFLACSMLVPADWTSALIWILVFLTMYLGHDTKNWASGLQVNLRDLSVELCLTRAQWTHQKGGHQGKCFTKANTNSTTSAYISRVPEVCKLGCTWIFRVFGPQPSTNLKASRSKMLDRSEKQLANPKHSPAFKTQTRQANMLHII